MFIPLWVLVLLPVAYFGMGVFWCVVATVSHPKLPTLKEYVKCLFLWPLMHIR